MSLELHDPWLLLLGAPFVLLALWRRRAPRAATVAFPTLRSVPRRPTLRVALLPLPRVLTALAIAALVVAVARPRQGEARSLVRQEGIAISLVLDRSGSMDEPMEFEGRRVPRIEIVKQVFRRFVAGGEGLPGRETDLLGLLTFARFPEEACPLVGQYEPLLSAVASLRTVPPFITRERVPTRDPGEAAAPNPLSATAIGDALYRGVLTLVAAEDDVARGRAAAGDAAPDGYAIRGKALILLTDGQSNAGRAPREVADLAAENGIRVYYVLLMGRDIQQETFFGRRVAHHLSDDEVDQLMAEPRAIAAATGGEAFFADDGDALEQIYARIDALERVDLGRVEYTSFRELFAWPLLAGVVLLLAAGLLDETVLRRAP